MLLYGLGEETASFLVGGFGIGGITLESMAQVEPVIHTQRGKSRLVVFGMVTDNGHSPAVNKAVTMQISQDAGAYTDTANTVGELGTGLYYILLTDSELDATVITAIIGASGCRSKVLIIYTNDNETKLIQIQEKTDKHPADLASEITLIKGALGFNCVMDDFVYDINGKATSGNVYIYDSVANALGHVAGGGPGLLKKIEGVAVITSGNTTKLTRTEV
ncbi:MAG: hypothetical protein ACE5GM_09985 [bacterium]